MPTRKEVEMLTDKEKVMCEKLLEAYLRWKDAGRPEAKKKEAEVA